MSSRHLSLLLFLLILTSGNSTAQTPPNKNNDMNINSNNNPYFPNANFNPKTAILIIILISAFFFLGFFSIYIRQCTAASSATPSRAAVSTVDRSFRRHGLDPEILSAFPTLIYSEVKEHKLCKSALECAVCLSEFDDHDALRLLPNCSHVFHTDCIDTWLAAHVTCPVCRCNLTESVQKQEPVQENDCSVEKHVVIEVEDEEDELEKFVNTKRARFIRSYTTGHAVAQTGANLDRYTLKLPENVRNDIMLKRTSSCVVVFSREQSEKKGYRSTEKWGSFLKRTISMKNRGFFRRDDSVKGEGSVAPKGSSFRHVINPLDCYGSNGNGNNNNEQSNLVEKIASDNIRREKE